VGCQRLLTDLRVTVVHAKEVGIEVVGIEDVG